MKKISLVLLFVVALTSFSCGKTIEKNEISNETISVSKDLFANYEDNEYTEINVEDSFYSYANGYWGYLNDLGTSFEFLVIDDGFFDTGVYEGASDRDGEITSVTMLSDGEYEVVVFKQECDDWFGDYMPEESATFFFNFDGMGNLILINSDTKNSYCYTYMGNTIDDAIKYFENEWKQSNNTITDYYQSNFYKYMNKTVEEIRNEYGYEDEDSFFARRGAMMYHNDSIPIVFYTYDLGSNEKAMDYMNRNPVADPNAVITGFVSDYKGTEIYAGIKIGDNASKIKDFGVYTEFDGASAISYPGDGGEISWVFDYFDNTIIFAQVTYSY